ncbi:MAG: DUF4190 domain-containing protein [Clostridiales bacterium]|nr:DUF4190 domain-containing protein [Clostridiales bacterium]
MSDEYRGDSPVPGSADSAGIPVSPAETVTGAPAFAAQTPPSPQYIPGTQAPQYQQTAGGVPPVPPIPPVPPVSPSPAYGPAGNTGQASGYSTAVQPYSPPAPPVPPPNVPPQQTPQQTVYTPYPQQRPTYPSAYTPYPVSTPQPGRGLAVASMVLGIVSLLFISTLYVTAVCGIIGLVLGCIAKSRQQGGMAVAGIILSSIALGLCVLIFVFFIIVLAIGVGAYDGHWFTAAFSLLR